MVSDRKRELVYALGIAVSAAAAYATLELLDVDFFVLQGAVIPVRIALGWIVRLLRIDVGLDWLDASFDGAAARTGRALAFATTALFVYGPTRLYALRPSRRNLVLMCAAWLLVTGGILLFVFLIIALDAAWSD